MTDHFQIAFQKVLVLVAKRDLPNYFFLVEVSEQDQSFIVRCGESEMLVSRSKSNASLVDWEWIPESQDVQNEPYGYSATADFIVRELSEKLESYFLEFNWQKAIESTCYLEADEVPDDESYGVGNLSMITN
jgi:hypothetical protein